MFDQLKGMASMTGLLKDLPRIKAKFEEIKQRLGEATVAAETGGGAVRCKANGLLKVLEVRVDQSLLAGLIDPENPDDKVMAEDLIAGAVNAALASARELAEREMAAAAGELGLPIPPGGLAALMG